MNCLVDHEAIRGKATKRQKLGGFRFCLVLIVALVWLEASHAFTVVNQGSSLATSAEMDPARGVTNRTIGDELMLNDDPDRVDAFYLLNGRAFNNEASTGLLSSVTVDTLYHDVLISNVRHGPISLKILWSGEDSDLSTLRAHWLLEEQVSNAIVNSPVPSPLIVAWLMLTGIVALVGINNVERRKSVGENGQVEVKPFQESGRQSRRPKGRVAPRDVGMATHARTYVRHTYRVVTLSSRDDSVNVRYYEPNQIRKASSF